MLGGPLLMQELCTVTRRTHTHTLRHWEREDLLKIQQHRDRRLTQNPATQREKTYSKSSNTETEDLLTRICQRQMAKRICVG